MFYKIMHQLFGFHYAIYSDSATSFVFRVKKFPDGDSYMRSSTGVYFGVLGGDGTFKNNLLTSGKYYPLTWSEDNDR